MSQFLFVFAINDQILIGFLTQDVKDEQSKLK